MTKQRTIKDTAEVKGIGLQTGAPVTMRLKNAPADSGINFIRTDLPNKPLLHLQSVDFSDAASAERRTSLGMGPLQIQTTEHLLAAISGLGIDNIIVELDNVELPGLDGSALEFAKILKKAQVSEQQADKKILKIEKPIWCEEGGAFLAVFPCDMFRISYTLSYVMPLGAQFLDITVDEKSFEREIAPARTFCLEAEALELLKRGLGKGANYDNTLVIGKDGPIRTSLRFPDEPVRHKVLDLIGDLYLIGRPVQGHVVAIKSGHKLNMELVKKLKAMPHLVCGA